jgi:8-oxo-dGTP pyrophosphatase MutT (NUDIX family)
VIEKVTAFVTRKTGQGHDLLLFEHPYAGIQIPAGTVEDGEPVEKAALREAGEETGLTGPSLKEYLGSVEDRLPEGQVLIGRATRVYARPDTSSFDWGNLPRSVQVTLLRRAEGFAQVRFEEPDRFPDPQYASMLIVGWVPDEFLAFTLKRHFFHLEYHGSTDDRWTVFTDNHRFTLFWAPLSALPPIIQAEWLAHLPLKYRLTG